MRATRLFLASGDRERLESWLAEPTLGHSSTTRIRIILLAADGWLNVAIAAELGVSVNTVTTWRARYLSAGIDGLVDRPRSGRPRSIDRAGVVAATLLPPTRGHSRWSCRDLGAHLGVGEATVARVWREYGLTPLPGRTYGFAVQPALTARTIDIVGLYLTPQTRAVALVVEPTSASNSQPSRVPGPHDPLDHDDLLDRDHLQHHSAAHPADRKPGAPGRTGLSRFVDDADRANPDRQLHVVVDNAVDVRRLMIANSEADQAGARLHFTVSTEIWLNLLDVFAELDPVVRDEHPAARARTADNTGTRMIWVRHSAELCYEESVG